MTPQIYVPSLQMWEPNARLAVRTVAGTAAPLQAYKQAIWSVAPTQAVFNIRSMNQMLSNATAEPRFRTSLVGSFALLALVLSAAGIYGLVSYLVSQRTREIGVRVALGASRRQVLGLVLRQGARLAIAGVVVGLAGALALARLVASLLYGVGAFDPLTFAAVPLVLTSVALLATYGPARRATRVDPLIAMRD